MWYVEQNGKPMGPYNDEQVKALCETGVVNAGTRAWKQGMADWMPLGQTDFAFRNVAAAPPLPGTSTAAGTPGAGGQQLAAPGTYENLSLWGYFWRCLTGSYAEFHGRARRKEYWSYVLFWMIFFIVALTIGVGIDAAVGNFSGGSSDNKAIATLILGVIYYFGTLLPGLAVRVRRLHDIGLSGWLVLIGLIPYLGGIALFVMSVLPSERGANKHGASPVPVT